MYVYTNLLRFSFLVGMTFPVAGRWPWISTVGRLTLAPRKLQKVSVLHQPRRSQLPCEQ